MDRPFAGKESISPAPFEIAIGNMQEWDSVIAPATGGEEIRSQAAR